MTDPPNPTSLVSDAELQRVIVADQQRIVMRRNLEDALTSLTGTSGARIQPEPTTPTLAPTPSAPSPSPGSAGGADAQSRAKTALEHYNRAQEALKQGDWATYGREMDAVRKELDAMSQGK